METLQRTANRGSISTGYDIDNSCKFEIDNSECLTKTFGSSGNRKAWTWSSWVKRTELNSSTTYQLLFSAGTGNPPRDVFFFDADTDDTLCFFSNGGLFSSTTLGFRTNAVFRDTSAWYHIVLVLDSANSTAADRLKLYVNGVSQTFSTYNAPTQNADSLINSNTDHAIARDSSFEALGFNAQYFSGYMAETHFVDGSALAPTDFGEYDEDSGIWKPKAYTGSYGTNGFYLDFADASDLGDDESGNGNDWTEVNITAADQATDTPTNNFAIGNVLTSKEGFLVTTEGATKGVLSAPGNNTGGTSLISTIPVSKGKWYFEAQNTNSGDVYLYLGVGDTGSINLWGIDGVKLSNQTSSSVAWRGGGAQDGKVYGRSAGTNYTSTNPVTWETEVVGLALDLDNEKIYFHKSGTWINSGDPANGTANGGQYDLVTGVDNQWCIAVSAYNLATWHINFGGYTTMSISSAASDANGYGTFEYAPPSGYYALCTKNLAEYG
jgi:hypothetical protein